MRGFLILLAAVAAAIGVGIGVEAAVGPSEPASVVAAISATTAARSLEYVIAINQSSATGSAQHSPLYQGLPELGVYAAPDELELRDAIPNGAVILKGDETFAFSTVGRPYGTGRSSGYQVLGHPAAADGLSPAALETFSPLRVVQFGSNFVRHGDVYRFRIDLPTDSTDNGRYVAGSLTVNDGRAVAVDLIVSNPFGTFVESVRYLRFDRAPAIVLPPAIANS